MKFNNEQFKNLVELVGFNKEDHYAIYPMLNLLMKYTSNATLDAAAEKCYNLGMVLRNHQEGAQVAATIGAMIEDMKSE